MGEARANWKAGGRPEADGLLLDGRVDLTLSLSQTCSFSVSVPLFPFSPFSTFNPYIIYSSCHLHHPCFSRSVSPFSRPHVFHPKYLPYLCSVLIFHRSIFLWNVLLCLLLSSLSEFPHFISFHHFSSYSCYLSSPFHTSLDILLIIQMGIDVIKVRG